MSGIRNFFSLQRQNCGMPQISLILTDIFTKREKSVILFYFCFFFYPKRGNLEAASLTCISDFVDKNA